MKQEKDAASSNGKVLHLLLKDAASSYIKMLHLIFAFIPSKVLMIGKV
jgi:hypothetical protein